MIEDNGRTLVRLPFIIRIVHVVEAIGYCPRIRQWELGH